MMTSSSLRMGIERTCWGEGGLVRGGLGGRDFGGEGRGREGRGEGGRRGEKEGGEGGRRGGGTLCFSRSSLLRGALIITRRTLEGALKCALRDFLREEWRAGSHFVSCLGTWICSKSHIQVFIFVMMAVGCIVAHCQSKM